MIESLYREVPKTDLVGFRKRSSNNDLVSGSGRDNGNNGNVYAHDGASDDQGGNSIA